MDEYVRRAGGSRQEVLTGVSENELVDAGERVQHPIFFDHRKQFSEGNNNGAAVGIGFGNCAYGRCERSGGYVYTLSKAFGRLPKCTNA